jgi:ABC-type lipopolysaccharide export system ATPase subunit
MKKQRNSATLTQVEARITGLRAIDPSLSFGNNRSLTDLTHLADQIRTKLTEHNNLLAALELSRNELSQLEQQAKFLASQMLQGVGFEYGRDSYEYELAGGVRTRDRIRKGLKTRLKMLDSQHTTVA